MRWCSLQRVNMVRAQIQVLSQVAFYLVLPPYVTSTSECQCRMPGPITDMSAYLAEHSVIRADFAWGIVHLGFTLPKSAVLEL